MPQNTNLNISPYFDDFDKANNFYRVLFRPGYPIQARELTTMQSLMQNQIESFGSHMFKDGSMVIPGQIGYDLDAKAVILQGSFLGADVEQYRTQLDGKIISGLTTGVKAKIIFSIPASTSERGYITLSSTNAVIFSPDFTGSFNTDEIITQTRTIGGQQVTARGRVVSWNSTTKVLKYYQNRVDGIFPEISGNKTVFDGGNTIVGSGSGTSADPDINFPIIPGEATRVINNTEYDLGMSFTSGYAKPEVKKDSGKVIYIDNRRAISRAGDQIEDIKIVVEF